MSLLIISIVVNCLVLIVCAQEEVVAAAAVSADSFSPALDPSSSWSISNEFKSQYPDKIYSECGTACPLTCAQPKSRPCILICKPGWFCPKDYYENSAGKCVPLEDCDSDSITPAPPQHLPGHIVGRPRPRPRPFPFPGYRPAPFPRPIPVNFSDIPADFGSFPDFPNFPNFNSTQNEFPKIHLPMGPPRPRPTFQINPIGYNATAVANGAPIPPPAVIRTSGSNLPYIGLPSIVPKSKPLIDLDPTVPRPVSRVSQEQSSDADN